MNSCFKSARTHEYIHSYGHVTYPEGRICIRGWIHGEGYSVRHGRGRLDSSHRWWLCGNCAQDPSILHRIQTCEALELTFSAGRRHVCHPSCSMRTRGHHVVRKQLQGIMYSAWYGHAKQMIRGWKAMSGSCCSQRLRQRRLWRVRAAQKARLPPPASKF